MPESPAALLALDPHPSPILQALSPDRQPEADPSTAWLPDATGGRLHRWGEVWRTVRELQAGAWSSLPAAEVLAELCRALLRCGNWRLAQQYLLHTASTPLPAELAEQIVVAAGREYFHSANAHDAPELAQVALLLLLRQPPDHIISPGDC